MHMYIRMGGVTSFFVVTLEILTVNYADKPHDEINC